MSAISTLTQLNVKMSTHSYTLDPTPDIPLCTHRLRVNKCNDLLIQSCASVIQQAAGPATTTLPSEGHQNVLVNAAFVLRRGGVALDAGAVCTVLTTDGTGIEEGEAEKGRERGFKEAVVHLQDSPLGLTRCESLSKEGMGYESIT